MILTDFLLQFYQGRVCKYAFGMRSRHRKTDRHENGRASCQLRRIDAATYTYTVYPPRELWPPKCLVYGGRYSNWLCYGRSISNRRNPTEVGVLFYFCRQFAAVKGVVDHSSSRLPYIADLALNAPM
ncbi:hypothetical protein AVEN_187618-1 [Araneus ventricosus]|uniref:Uncharacterized protein n=1 Tax=Araneus ventricosus TaxID=182803 RepID=A0A4Y2K306_ARAVE|nr:hypothetical protein AVEN_187618-1 [Araneus ventricosus]